MKIKIGYYFSVKKNMLGLLIENSVTHFTFQATNTNSNIHKYFDKKDEWS